MALDHKKLAIILGFAGPKGGEEEEDSTEDLEAGMEELGAALAAKKWRDAAEIFRDCLRLCELTLHSEREDSEE